MARDLYKYFRLEAHELLEQFDKAILVLEKDGADTARVRLLLRLAHTLKGAARVVKQPEIADSAHAIEDVLAPHRESAEGLPRRTIDVLLGHLDAIRERLRALSPAEAEASRGPATPADDGPRMVRADLTEMDALLDGVSETQAALNGLRPAAQAAERARHLVDLLLEQLVSRTGAGSVDGDESRPGSARATAEELRRAFGRLERDMSGAIDQMDRELRQLREATEQLRLVPASALFTLLERTARDASAALSRPVAFEGKGGEIRLDAHVLGTIQPALVQIVRNAVAHGIEAENERRLAGKAAIGRITVEASHRGRDIVFICRDDGKGVDIEAVRRAALRRGLLGPQVAGHGSEELIRLLLQGGLTTSSSVTEISGRGIGLDVVREAIARLNGRIAFNTAKNAGTTFELVVPSSLAALDALVVEAGALPAAIPLDAVKRSMRLAAGDISWSATGATVVRDGEALPFLPLPAALHGTPSPPGRSWPAVVVGGAAGSVAVGVDRLVGTARIVTRPLPASASASPIVAAAWLDAQGEARLVLDPEALLSAARHGAAVEREQLQPARSVLVVDDSLTTRMLERTILESAGYEADVATSAEEALEIARGKRYALFLVDVEMPGMTGFAFVERIRADPALRDVPAILVTSRSAPEDLQRGRDAGAQGYMVKSEFDQAELLATIRTLIG
jgi:two-component system chemotaxis sensor kinase CheA